MRRKKRPIPPPRQPKPLEEYTEPPKNVSVHLGKNLGRQFLEYARAQGATSLTSCVREVVRQTLAGGPDDWAWVDPEMKARLKALAFGLGEAPSDVLRWLIDRYGEELLVQVAQDEQ